MLTGFVVGAVAFAAGGMLSPLWLRSPQEVAAEAQPPGLTTLTASVEQRVLRDVLVARGEIKAGQSFDVTASSRSGGPGVVTAIKVHQGDQVKAGTVVVEVSGRPLIVLPGTVPAYRDIKPGLSGKDVKQLQVALAQSGYDPHERNGVFGARTKAALQSFYNALGYDALPVNDGDEARLAQLHQQVTAAQRSVSDAQDALDALIADPSSTPAQRTAAQKVLTRSKEDLASAQDVLAKAEWVSGPMLPLNEYVFLPAFPARVDALNAVLGKSAGSPTITLSTGEPVVAATVTTAQMALCKKGARVDIVGDSGLTATGRVSSVGAAPQGPQAPGQADSAGNDMIALIAPSSPLDHQHIGESVLLKIEVAVSDGAQLVVPISALFAAADGQTYVTKVLADGKQVRVVVTAGLSAEGYVVVTSSMDSNLTAGDRVIIGEASGG